MWKRDLERTATGWAWSDRLTAPYWRWRSWLSLRRIDRMLGITGDKQERRRRRRALWTPADMDQVEWRGDGDE